jgi:mannose-6-phosphate isomerase
MIHLQPDLLRARGYMRQGRLLYVLFPVAAIAFTARFPYKRAWLAPVPGACEPAILTCGNGRCAMAQDFVRYPLLMTPIFSARPWGGTRLARILGKAVPAQGGPFGESWELSDHPNGRSAIANGPYAGEQFGDLVRRFPQAMCAVQTSPERFPLLVKYIDAGEDLSIQVHPNDAQAAEVGDRGKTECWFVMDCEEGARLIFGLAPGVSAESLRQAAESGQMDASLRQIPIRPGDFLYVPAGMVHAILAGTLICEVQQSSDTTYRLWDWNRQPPRPLHIEESCRVAQYDPAQVPAASNVRELPAGRWHRLVRNEFFEVSTAVWPAAASATLEVENRHGLVLNVIEGSGRLIAPDWDAEALERGQTWFLPAGLSQWEIETGLEGLRLLMSQSLELD